MELAGREPAFAKGANSKALTLKATPEGWKFSVRFVPLIVRKKSLK